MGYDDNGKIRTFDLFCIFAGWDGGNIHDALRYFKDQTKDWQDRFCTELMRHLDRDQLLDIESGWASMFFKARL